MPITWETTTRFLDPERTRVSITAVGTDSEDVENPITVQIQDARVGNMTDETKPEGYKPIDIVTNKSDLWANIKDHYDRKKVARDEEDAAVFDLNAEAKAGLEKL